MFGMTEPYFGRRIAILGVVAPVRVLVMEPVPSLFMSNGDGNSYVVGFWFCNSVVPLCVKVSL